MSDWISVAEQLPQDGEPVWIRLSQRTPQGIEPPCLLDGHFRIHPTLGACFEVGPYDSICYLSTVWAGHGLNYWQPKTANEHPAPDPHLDASTKPNQSPQSGVPLLPIAESIADSRQVGRKYNFSPEGRERRSQKMRDYWAKRRADAAAATADDK